MLGLLTVGEELFFPQKPFEQVVEDYPSCQKLGIIAGEGMLSMCLVSYSVSQSILVALWKAGWMRVLHAPSLGAAETCQCLFSGKSCLGGDPLNISIRALVSSPSHLLLK